MPSEFYRVKRLPPYVFEEVNRLKAEARARGADIIDFGMGNPDLATPDFIVDKLIETIRKPRTNRYSASRGIQGLRRAQAAYYDRRFGVKLNPDTQVIATLGSKEGLANMAQAITAPGDVILVPNPTYPIHQFGFLLSGGVIRHLPAQPDEEFLRKLDHAMHAIATVIKPKAHVVALLVAAENCISENAYRPDDVITYRNGVTVEVTNTDAEGRLVLADGLIWACEVERASKIVDMATLTGGVVTAIGHVFAGGFGNDDAHYSALEQAGKSSGDKMWRLPLHDEYKEYMKSPIADIVNSVKGGKAHPVQGGTFLSFFVEEGTPWVHIDIAGKAMPADGPTGFGVRILAEWLEQTAS